MVSPDVESYTASGIPWGSASGRIYRDTTWIVRRSYALPCPVFTIKDFDAKYYTMARLAVEADVTFVGTPNPSTILRLATVADAHRDQIIRDIFDGVISDRFEIEPDVRRALARSIRPNPSRARELEGFVSQRGALRPAEYWPRLQLVGCWKGGSVGLQLEKARAYFGPDVPTRDLGYLASEAHMSVPIQDAGSGGVLAVTSHVYEFVPESDIDATSPRTLLCDEVELGQTYYPILTTTGGLYRYDINDVVRVVGFHHATPLIEFVRKGRDVTSIGGEKLHVSQLVTAFERTQRQLDLICSHYRAVACLADNRYAFLVEFEGGAPTAQDLDALRTGVDAELGNTNLEYRDKRRSGRLGDPILHRMRAGWHERSYRRRIAAGARDSQFKATLLSVGFEEGELHEIEQTVPAPD